MLKFYYVVDYINGRNAKSSKQNRITKEYSADLEVKAFECPLDAKFYAKQSPS